MKSLGVKLIPLAVLVLLLVGVNLFIGKEQWEVHVWPEDQPGQALLLGTYNELKEARFTAQQYVQSNPRAIYEIGKNCRGKLPDRDCEDRITNRGRFSSPESSPDSLVQ